MRSVDFNTLNIFDLLGFVEVANLRKEKKHLTSEGLNKIFAIKAGMNKGISYILNSPSPKPHAFVSLPLQSNFGFLSLAPRNGSSSDLHFVRGKKIF